MCKCCVELCDAGVHARINIQAVKPYIAVQCTYVGRTIPYKASLPVHFDEYGVIVDGYAGIPM